MTSRRRSREEVAAPTELVRSPDPRFTCNANYKWYKDQLGKKFVEETHVPEELDNLYGVTASFDVLGWTPILGLPKDYFPDLVREFYANLEEREKDICVCLHSTVAGVAIEITERKLNTWFGLKGVGDKVQFQPDGHGDTLCLTLPAWDMFEIVKKLDVAWSWSRKNQWTVYAKHSAIGHRLLAYIFRQNVFPANSTNELRLTDIFTLHMMQV
ncbi:hypothetical protein COLO4_37078 [Corchorus olitorius]|uniref:Putative plant transposon protein domain-containing protein n=1 Tax=Corchorus olitorius TaxID=93759 RepID=A0A1R3G3F4_9ROSI|nr:hypothetical protein COLO4_37078 [Corchorus olitorius]